MRRDRLVALAIFAGVVVLGIFTFTGLRVRNEIADFVPNTEERDLAEIARAVTDSELSRTIVLEVGPGTASEVASAAGELGDLLADAPGVAWVTSGPPEGIDRAMYELYFPRRYAFIAESAEEASALVAGDALDERAAELRRDLTGPTAMLVRRIAPTDPIEAFPRFLRRAQASGAGGPDVVDGHFVTPVLEGEGVSDRWGVVLLSTSGSVFSADAQEPVLRAIDAAFAKVHASHPAFRLEQAGVQRFAVAIERGLRADTQRISTLSTLGIIFLFVLLFRGPRFLFLGTIPLAVGTVLATASCRLVFGSVHGITIAFGSALLGVGIDFVAHYVNHHVLLPAGSPEQTMKKLWPGLSLGALTTIAGLLGLGWTSFPGMRELALFAGVGVLASLLATRYLVPPFMPEKPAPTRIHRWLASVGERAWRGLVSRRRIAVVVPIAASVVCLAGLSRAELLDDLRAMNQSDPALVAEDRAVRSRIAQGEAGRLVIATGVDDEDALARNDLAYAALTEATRAGELDRFRSAHPVLPSSAQQTAVDAAVRGRPNLGPAMLDALERAGFVRELFSPFAESLETPAPPPLDFAAFDATPAGVLARPFRIHAGDRIAYVSFVEGVHDGEALAARLRRIDGVRYFDQRVFLTSAYGTFRARTTELILGGLFVVLAMCWIKYRKVSLALAAVAPAILAAASSLAIVSLFGEPLNLMHLVACLLVLSMGEDYSVFLIEVRDDDEGPGVTLVGLAIAGLTTILSFGLLALSAHPALHALGIVTSLGVLLSMLFAPLGLVFVGRSKA